MSKWGIFNASLLHNEHGHPPFLFQNWSSHMINIQWEKFKQKSIVTFISEKLPRVGCVPENMFNYREEFHSDFLRFDMLRVKYNS